MRYTNKEECEIFRGAKVGQVASTRNTQDYRVKGAYLDANGCMKTYGETIDGHDAESFIQGTSYKEDSDNLDGCLGERDDWGEYDCGYEFAGDITCDKCKYGPFPDEDSYDPRYDIEKQRDEREERNA